jgi:hypothetical protein
MIDFLKFAEFLGLVALLVVLCGLLGVAILGKLAVSSTAGMVAAPFVGAAMMSVVLWANADRRGGRR